MKKHALFTRSLLLVLMVLVISVVPALAGATTKTLSTNYTVVNLGTSDALVTASYYKDTGAAWAADPDKTNFTVPANYGQVGIRQYFDGTLSAGKGSVVLSSSEPLAAVVQIQARGQTPSSGAYIGYTSGSNQFFIPLIQRKADSANGTVNTQIMIQNIMNETISATVQFTPLPTTPFLPFTKPIASIPPYSTYYYDVTDELSTNLADKWIGSAVVTAQTGKQIAVVVNLFAGADGLNTINAFPLEGIGPSWAIPQFSSRLPNGFSTPINVQNVSGGDIAAGALSLTCNPAPGWTGVINKTNPATLPNNALLSFNPVTDQTFPTNWNGSCVVSTSPTANIVVFSQLRKPNITGEISAYEGFRTDSTNSKVIIPLVAKRLANGFATVANIMNLASGTGETAYIHLTFTRSNDCPGVGQATYTTDYTVDPRTNVQINMTLTGDPTGLSPAMPDGWCGSLVVTTTSGHTPRPLIAYMQLRNYLSSSGDQWMAHQAFIIPEP